jgi:protein SOK2
VSSERLPALQQQASASSASSSPRGGSFSASSVDQGSAGSHTSYSASVNGQTAGFKTPSPEQTPQSLNRTGQPLHAQSQQSSPYGTQQGYGFSPEGYSMNQMQSYPDVHQSQMSAATAHAPASAAPGGLSHYSYQPQPSLLPPGAQYGSAPAGYPPYGYPNGVPSQLPASSSMNNPLVPQAIQLPGMFVLQLDVVLTNNHSYGFFSAPYFSWWLTRIPVSHV